MGGKGRLHAGHLARVQAGGHARQLPRSHRQLLEGQPDSVLRLQASRLHCDEE